MKIHPSHEGKPCGCGAVSVAEYADECVGGPWKETRVPKETGIFQPIISVDDDGFVDVDFGDSFVWVVDENGSEVLLPESDPGSVLDALLGIDVDPDPHVSPATLLRRLADYIDAHPKGATT